MYKNAKINNNIEMHYINNYNPLVSIIIPTYNEESTIERKILNIFEQNYTNFEVNIIDSASRDKTIEIINNTLNKNKFNSNIIIEKERRGKSFALNRIFKECNGDIIFITDADVVLKKNAIKNIVKNFTNKEIGAVTGRQVLVNEGENIITSNEAAYKNIFDVLRKGESNVDSTMIFNGPAMAFRSSLLNELPEDTIADDTFLAMMIREKGYKTIFDENVVFYESVPRDRTNFINQKIRRGQGLIQAFMRNSFFLFNGKYGLFGLVLFPAEFFMHIVSPFLSVSLAIIVLYIAILNSLFLYLVLGTGIIIAISFIIGIQKTVFAFIEYQLILLLSLISHSVGIQQHKWQIVNRQNVKKIEDL